MISKSGIAIGLVMIMSAGSAFAQGHIAGGAVGAAVGAKSHHAVAGAVVGGAVGHHMAKTHQKKLAAKGAPPK